MDDLILRCMWRLFDLVDSARLLVQLQYCFSCAIVDIQLSGGIFDNKALIIDQVKQMPAQLGVHLTIGPLQLSL